MELPGGAVRILVLSILSTILATIAIVLRLWSRYIQRSPLALNDWMAILAFVFSVGSVANDLIAVIDAGVGYHLVEVVMKHPEKLVLFLKIDIPGQILWGAGNACLKFSILSLYTVIFPGRRFHQLCYATMALTLAYFVSVFIEAWVFCHPVQYSWDKTIEGSCNVNGQTIAYTVSGVNNLVLDMIVVALPMPTLFGLQMSLQKKLGVISMFSLGAAICVLSLLRVIAVTRWDLNDITYSVVDAMTYSILEPTLGIVNICLPTIKPAILVIAGRRTASGAGSRTAGAYSYNSKGSSGFSGSRSGHSSRAKSRAQGTVVKDVRPADLEGLERHDDEFPLTNIRVEGGSSDTFSNGNSFREITVERGWQVQEHR